MYLGGQIYLTLRLATTTSTPWSSDARPKERLAAWAATPSPDLQHQWTSRRIRVPVSRSVQVEFRAETFNTFNHTQWAGVSAGISVPNPSSPVTASSQGSTAGILLPATPAQHPVRSEADVLPPNEVEAGRIRPYPLFPLPISICALCAHVCLAWLCAGDALLPVFQKAVAALSSGDYAAAEAGFQQVLKAAPNHVGALGNLGVVYSRTSRPDKAIAAYQRALRVVPQDKALMLNLGLIYVKQESYTDALPLFEKLVAANGSNLQARELLATCQLNTGRVAAAIQGLEALRKEDPATTASVYMVGIAYLGRTKSPKKPGASTSWSPRPHPPNPTSCWARCTTRARVSKRPPSVIARFWRWIETTPAPIANWAKCW